MTTVQPQETIEGWIWCGYAGHFIGASNCRMHLHTRVGDYRISTVGDYRPPHHQGEEPEEIGWGRTYETFVFRVVGFGQHGEGEMADASEIDSEGYTDGLDAERGHMAMCAKYHLISMEERGHA